ncbi:immunity protein Imm33 domain-containing protein [Clostridium paraputrificum]|uniref:immunity protein Imm33 domain-containing protein n=1 Tax=Clostridium paraputrificum TaxID=29363 RepID=UPI003D3525F4
MFYEGTESEEYLKDTSNMGVYTLNTIANYDPDIILLLNSSEDKSFCRDRNGRFCEDN